MAEQSKSNLVIRDKVEQLGVDLYAVLRRYPKSERHVLAAETRASLYRLLRYVITAAKIKNKSGPLNAADAEICMLNALLRIGMQLEYLPFPAYKRLIKRIDEIGRMVGGWIKKAA
jgi:hypothetical protein